MERQQRMWQQAQQEQQQQQRMWQQAQQAQRHAGSGAQQPPAQRHPNASARPQQRGNGGSGQGNCLIC
tara:strand:- start:1072 stop:1275 length:204 start_codon:yes stop_codon:yes gene_type:complete